MNYIFTLALRGLTKSPLSSVLAAIALSIGIAATLTSATLLIVLNGDPIPGVTENLYLAWTQTIPEVREIAQNPSLFGSSFPSKVTPYVARDFERTYPDSTVILGEINDDVLNPDSAKTQLGQHILATSSNFANIFQLPLRRGRFWTKQEQNDSVAVIDSELSEKLFGRHDAIGKIILIKGHTFEVIGITEVFRPEPHFYGLSSWSYSSIEREAVFVPYGSAIDASLDVVSSDGCPPKNGGGKDQSKLDGPADPQSCAWLSPWLYLPGASDVNDAKRFLKNYTLSHFASDGDWVLLKTSDWLSKNHVVPTAVKLNFLLSICFLILCMIDASALMASKFMRGIPEISLRRALGATRPAVFLQYICESLLLTFIGGFFAVPLILIGLYFTRSQPFAYMKLAQPSVELFLLLLGICCLIGVLVGTIPAWRVAIAEPGLRIKEE